MDLLAYGRNMRSVISFDLSGSLNFSNLERLRNRALTSSKFGEYVLSRHRVFLQGQTGFLLGPYQSSVYILSLSK